MSFKDRLTSAIQEANGGNEKIKADPFSRSLFYFLKGLAISASLLASYVVAQNTIFLLLNCFEAIAPSDSDASLKILGILLLGVLALGAAIIYAGTKLTMSPHAGISLVGAILTTLPLGLIMGPVCYLFTQSSGADALALTASGCAIMMSIGALWPIAFSDIFGYIVLAVIGLFLSAVGLFWMGYISPDNLQNPWIWGATIILTGYMIYCLDDARDIPVTADNAVDFVGVSMLFLMMGLLRIILEIAFILLKSSGKSKR